jgi:hypothetical protein
MKRIPARYLAVFLTISFYILLSFQIRYAEVSEQQIQRGNSSQFTGVGWGFAPPPPIGVYVREAIVVPGVLAALPFLVVAILFESEFVARICLVVGAAFFWYALFWYADRARGLIKSNTPPKHISMYLMVARVGSLILLPFIAWRGFSLGVHYCAYGVPPYWSEVAMYGIVLVWATVGSYYAWTSYTDRHRERDLVRLSLNN